MQSNKQLLTTLLLLILLLLAACRPTDPGAGATATSAPPATETTPAQTEPTPTTAVEPTATAEPTSTVEATPTAEVSEPGPDLEALRQEVATIYNVPVDNVSVNASELLPSPELCLGVFDGGDCYRVTLLVDGEPRTFHVNNSGNYTGLVDSVPAQPGQIILTFGRENCQVGALRQEAPPVGLGPCGSEFTFFDFAGEDAAAELQEMLSSFAAFTAVTPSGFISFGGNGSDAADAQQQEDIAAWMRQVLDAAIAQGPGDDALCSRLARPLLVTQSQGRFAIADPLSGEQCDLTLPGEFRGNIQAAGNFLFLQDVEGSDILIREISPDGTLRPLEATRIDSAQGSLLGWAVSPDGQTIAWSVGTFSGEPGLTSSLYVASTSAETAQTLIADLTREDGRGLIPVRFDDSGETLVYTLQPIGIGGSWPSFVGRYDSLYIIPSGGGEGQQVLDCPALGLFLCIGDFRLQDNAIQTIAYVRENTIEVVEGDGASVASIAVDAEYVAYPTFSPEDELVFFTATIGEGDGGFPFAEPGAYYRIGAPYSAEPALIAQQDGLMTPYQWFDAGHLIVGVGDATGSWGTGLLGLDGSVTRLEPWPDTAVVAVIR